VAVSRRADVPPRVTIASSKTGRSNRVDFVGIEPLMSRPVSVPSEPITTVLADDHAIVRNGLRNVLERTGGEFAVVAEAHDLESTLTAVHTHRPQLLIVDVTMPGGSSISALPQLRQQYPDLSIVVLTMHEDPGYARAALQSGAHSFVLKQAEPEELLRAFRVAAGGGFYVDPRAGAQLAASEANASVPLSDREREIVRQLALGYTNAEIAQRLYLSERTVKTYRARAVAKLGVSTRAELTEYARAHGLIA
jgi:two-component system response regulator NreC